MPAHEYRTDERAVLLRAPIHMAVCEGKVAEHLSLNEDFSTDASKFVYITDAACKRSAVEPAVELCGNAGFIIRRHVIS